MSHSSSPSQGSQNEFPIIDPCIAQLDKLRSSLARVSVEVVSTEQAIHRIVAQDIHAFRDSPAIDVSAMDGYAIRLDDLDGSVLPITATSTAGSPPVQLEGRSAIRVFTGGPVPSQAQCVVRREDCNESETYVSIAVPKESLFPGQNIRRQGENAAAGGTVVPEGTLLTPSRYAGAITFSEETKIQVFRKVRVGIINTGDELIDFGKPIQPWQIRDSNGPFLEAMLHRHAFLKVTRTKVHDQQDDTRAILEAHLQECDVILLTGGVSMGDTDFVPDAIQSCGCTTIFHRLPIRPGKPILGAVGPRGQLVLGLPGNPLSVAVTFRRFALGLIQHVAGFARADDPLYAQLDAPDDKAIQLTWFRLVKVGSHGRLNLVPSQGSGDIASLIQSDGFVQIPPNAMPAGQRLYYPWLS